MHLLDLTPWQIHSHFEDQFYLSAWAAMWGVDIQFDQFKGLIEYFHPPGRRAVSEDPKFYLGKHLSMNPLDRKEELVDLEVS